MFSGDLFDRFVNERHAVPAVFEIDRIFANSYDGTFKPLYRHGFVTDLCAAGLFILHLFLHCPVELPERESGGNSHQDQRQEIQND